MGTDLAESQNRQQQAALEATTRAVEQAQEREALDKDECKRNRDKYTLIPLDCSIPMQPHDIPSTYVMRRLEKGQYFPLGYLTNDGLDSARCSNRFMVRIAGNRTP